MNDFEHFDFFIIIIAQYYVFQTLEDFF